MKLKDLVKWKPNRNFPVGADDRLVSENLYVRRTCQYVVGLALLLLIANNESKTYIDPFIAVSACFSGIMFYLMTFVRR